MPKPAAKKPSLRAALVGKLGNPDPRRLHDRLNGVRKRYGQMSRVDAHAVLAAELGVRLDRYLTEADLNRVRGIMANGGERPTVAAPGTKDQPRTKRQLVLKGIVLGGKLFDMDDPIIPSQVVADAMRMAEVYPLTYAFENSVRELVLRVMQRTYGPDWWKQPTVPRPVLNHVESNKRNEAAVPWHATRGVHDIHYTSIDDLLAIMFGTNENRPIFEKILGKDTSTRHLVEIIEHARHAIAHHRPLPPDEIQRLALNTRAWQELMRKQMHLIDELQPAS